MSGVLWACVRARDKPGPGPLSTLRPTADFTFDDRTTFRDILALSLEGHKTVGDFLAENAVTLTLHPTVQYKDALASPVSNIDRAVSLYVTPLLRCAAFRATRLSTVGAASSDASSGASSDAANGAPIDATNGAAASGRPSLWSQAGFGSRCRRPSR